MTIYTSNYQNVRTQTEVSWADSFSGALNLSAQNSAVAQIWARKNNRLLNLYINLLIMRLNIHQTIRMSEHRQRYCECTVSAGYWIWALKIQQSPKFEHSNITGRWKWAHKPAHNETKYTSNYQNVRTQTEELWAHSFSGLLNLSAQNSAVAQIWALKCNRLLKMSTQTCS